MNNVFKLASGLGKRAPDMTIAWEAQPSLQHMVRRTEDAHAPTWAETMPAPLDEMDAPVTFREPLEGLSVRDIDEPEIFRVFFGEQSTAPTVAPARA